MPAPSGFTAVPWVSTVVHPKSQKGKLRLREPRSVGWGREAARSRASLPRVCWDQRCVHAACLPMATVSGGPALQTANFPLGGLLEARGAMGVRGQSSMQGPGAAPGTARASDHPPQPQEGRHLSGSSSQRPQNPILGSRSAGTFSHFTDLETEARSGGAERLKPPQLPGHSQWDLSRQVWSPPSPATVPPALALHRLLPLGAIVRSVWKRALAWGPIQQVPVG